MKLALFALAAAAIPAAFATPVTYSTNNTQLCVGASGCGLTSQTIGGVSITYQPLINQPADPGGAFTFASFGTIQLSCVGGGTACGSQSLAGLNLYITIDQTSPLVGQGSIPSGVITGSISGTASNAQITWPSPASTTIGTMTYSIANSPLNLVPVSTNYGKTTIQGKITENAVPEPSTYLMFSAGLLALGLGRKFKRQA